MLIVFAKFSVGVVRLILIVGRWNEVYKLQLKLKRGVSFWIVCYKGFLSVKFSVRASKKGKEGEDMQKNLIESNPSVMMGKPVIIGTRITVELILEKMAQGETVEQLLEAHPRLTGESIQAALAFAAKALRADVVYPMKEEVA